MDRVSRVSVCVKGCVHTNLWYMYTQEPISAARSVQLDVLTRNVDLSVIDHIGQSLI